MKPMFYESISQPHEVISFKKETVPDKNELVLQKKNSKINDLEKALAYAEAIVTTIPTPLIILYPAFRIRTANKAFYKTFKVSAEETEGNLIYQLGNGQWNIPALKKLLEEILPKKNVLNDFEVEHTFEDIGHKIMLLNARRLIIHDSEPMILLAISDITEQRSIEADIEKERRIVLENIPSGLLMLNHKWQLTFCNKKFQPLAGQTITDTTGKNIWEILPEWSGSLFGRNCRKALKTSSPLNFEEYFPHINAWFCIQIYPSAEGLAIYFDDITKHKRGEELVEFERQKMFNLFMNAPALICVFRGPRHVYELANKPYMQMVGIKRNVIGCSIRKALPELKGQGIFEILDKVYNTGSPYIGKEMPVKLNKSPTEKTETILDFVFQPFSDTSGKVQGIIAYASDITILVNKRKEVEELSRQKDEFIGVASHELKTPVTSIKGYTQILQMRFQEEGNTRAVDLLSRMDSQINKLSKLIADLLDATKIEGGKLQFFQSWFDFNALVMEVVEEMQIIARRHKIIVKLALSAKIFGDRDRIAQVITNLISNAIKYSPDKDEIIVVTSKTKNTVGLCVQDFGIGIPKQNQDKVFDRFYRVSGDKEDTFPGMGLGLYISSEIIKRHKGEITVKSTVGKGSKFSFTLPVTRTESITARIKKSHAENTLI